MRKPGGYGVLTDPAKGRAQEHDTFTCKHCSTIVRVKPLEPPENMGGLCKVCMSLICPQCVGKTCHPWEEKLRMMEAKTAALRSYGL